MMLQSHADDSTGASFSRVAYFCTTILVSLMIAVLAAGATAAQDAKAGAQTRGEFGGLGIEVAIENGVLKVVAPIEGLPAAKAGLKAGDLITHVDNEPLEGLALEQAVEKLRGPANSSVMLTIVRKGRDEPFKVNVVREIIRVTAVKAHAEDDVAYIKITRFNDQAHKELVTAVQRLNTQIGAGLKGYILDLRNNPGGLFDQAVAVSDDVLEDGIIVRTKGRDQVETRLNAHPGDVTEGKKLVVLINGGTAAASEIVAGALQDHKRATIVGTRSFGQGTVQTIIPLGANGAIRLTTARYYTPANRSIEAKGIDPDIVVEQETTEGPSGKTQPGPAPYVYVPKDAKLDAALQQALHLLRSGDSTDRK